MMNHQMVSKATCTYLSSCRVVLEDKAWARTWSPLLSTGGVLSGESLWNRKGKESPPHTNNSCETSCTMNATFIHADIIDCRKVCCPGNSWGHSLRLIQGQPNFPRSFINVTWLGYKVTRGSRPGNSWGHQLFPTSWLTASQWDVFTVLDDIWESEVAKAFGVCCRVLVASCNVEVTSAVDTPNVYPVSVTEGFSDREARQLLSKTPPDSLPEEAKDIIQYCMGSPLALGIIAAKLSKSNTKAKWKAIVRQLNSRSQAHDVRKRMNASIGPWRKSRRVFTH